MRSQLFGFVVQTHLIYELLLDHSLQQAVTIMKQYLVENEFILPSLPVSESRVVHYLYDPVTIGFETYLNEWDEEIVQMVNGAVARHGLSHEWLRVEELKKALSWLWLQFRETTVLGQFVFSTTIDGHTLMTVSLGWNSGASLPDIALTEKFIPLYLRKLEKLGFGYDVVSFPLYPEELAAKPRKGKPSARTLEKLQELVAYRTEHIQASFVGIDKLQACADKNLAPKTVKKYAPTLYARWYDVAYEGDVH
jgi:hypothetical protein